MGVYDNKLTKLDAFDLKMVFKAIILLTCLVSAHATTIKCRTGAGASAGKHDANLDINLTDCEEGVTQCKLSGLTAGGLSAFKYGCGEKKVEPVGCKTAILKTKCYCTGDKCTPPNPTAAKTNSKMQCRTGAGVSAGKHDAKANINWTDCEEGVTQCKLSGLTAKGLSAFKYGCGEKKVQAAGCKTGKLTTNCYCTGTKCTPKSSANTIGTQATIGFAFILSFFSKIMAQNNSFDYTLKNI